MGKLYETDFFGWTREQADLLRHMEAGAVREHGELDWLTIAKLLEDSPSLREYRAREFEDAWRSARLTISALSGVVEEFFSVSYPFRLEEVEDRNFWPEPERTQP